MGQIILASASPRRKELLEQIGLEFEICPAKGEEVITAGGSYLEKRAGGGCDGAFRAESDRGRSNGKNI